MANDEIIPENFIKRINTIKTKPERNKTYTPDMQQNIYSYLKKNDPILLLIKNRTFNIILTTKEKGTGMTSTTNFDKTISYDGKAVSVKF